jgi:cytochrome c oxidase subunit 4
MAEHHAEPNYMYILYLLAALTVAEIVVVKVNPDLLAKYLLLVGMALTKACLVALYFMHLRFEPGTLMVIAFTPLLICTFLVFMLLPDLGGVVHKSSVRAEQTGVKH